MEAYLDGTFGFEISDEDVIQLFGALSVLFDEITNLQVIYRRVNKGVKLGIGTDGELVADPDPEMASLMQLYDRRRREFSSTFSPIGFVELLKVPDVTDLSQKSFVLPIA